MAGTLQTGTLVGGQWTTTNVDVNTVLERHQERKQEGLQTENESVPSFGLLTQTVISSSVIRWIFPARIRSSEYRDVAFIGDNFVQIRRLDSNGHFHDVARKDDFGQRIRNACLIGSSSFDARSVGDSWLSSQMYDGDILMMGTVESELVPPHFILLAMESGNLNFVFARNVGSDVKFITSEHKVLHKGITEPPAKHLKVDPSSRYVAVASSETTFTIYCLKSKEELYAHRQHGEPFQYFATEHHLHRRGVIHKMEFLHPASDDPDHIILLLLVVRNGSTAMFVYEWEAGQDLSEIHSNNLRVLFVSSDSITECRKILEGTPAFQIISQPEFAPSPTHLGKVAPLWTAWTRPLRYPRYLKGHDDIYMAREDGFIAFLEIVSGSAVLVQSTVAAGNLGSSIGTAFSNLELAPDGMDFLITGGDSSDGGSYLVAAKRWAQLVEPIPNWAPMIDFVTTARAKSPRLDSDNSSELSKRRKLVLDDPDRVFACTGRGSQGTISEIRYGFEARVRLDIEGIDYPVAETWAMPSRATNRGDLISEVPSPLLFLLSVGDESVLLHLPADLREIEEISQSSTWLDLKSRTLAALSYNGSVVQITERSINISAKPLIVQVDGIEAGICCKEYPLTEIIVAAAIFENELVLVVVKDANGTLQLNVLRVHVKTSTTNVITHEAVPTLPHIEVFGSPISLGEYPNSISIIRHSNGCTYGIICAADSGFTRGSERLVKSSVLSLSVVVKIDDTEGLSRVENAADYWPLNQKTECGVVPEACVSIANLRGPQRDPAQNEILLAGYRSGMLVMVRYKMGPSGVLEEKKTSQHPMGSTPVVFKTDPSTPNVALICCDSKLWRVTYDCCSNADPLLHRVWFTAVESPLYQQPAVNHVSLLPRGLLLYSENQLLVTSLDPEAKPVPRKIPLSGSPHRMLYSHRLEKLVVGMSQEGRSTIKFLDPQSGRIVSHHLDPTGRSVAFPSGLGVSGEKILCLVEWEWKTLNGNQYFLIVGTSDGSLLIYKAGLPDPTVSGPPQQGEIRCAILLKERYDEPVSAIVTCAKSFFFSVGQRVRWITWDLSENKLLTRAEYKLSSRVVSMSIEGHWLNALTAQHSLATLLLVDRRKHSKCADQHGQLSPQFTDETERSGLDQIFINDFHNIMKDDSTIVVVGDLDCTVAGLWYSKRAQSLVRNHKIIFEADLPFSILKFRFGRTRPPWDRVSKSFAAESIYNTSELLGMGVDGSFLLFTILEEGVWKLLRFLQDLTHQPVGDPLMRHVPSRSGNKTDPRTKHVDGEILRPYLSHRMLERLLMANEAPTEPETDSRVIEEFCGLVNKLHRADAEPPGQLADKSLEECLEETYQLLADLLRPVI